MQRGANPAQHHFSVAPAFDVSRVMRDQTVHVLDRIGRSNRFVERTLDAQRNERKCLRKALPQSLLWYLGVGPDDARALGSKGTARVAAGERMRHERARTVIHHRPSMIMLKTVVDAGQGR